MDEEPHVWGNDRMLQRRRAERRLLWALALLGLATAVGLVALRGLG